MPKTPIMSGQQVIDHLCSCFNFIFIKQKGSHVKLRTISEPYVTVIVPLHDELKSGTLAAILRQAKIDKEEFFEED